MELMICTFSYFVFHFIFTSLVQAESERVQIMKEMKYRVTKANGPLQV